VNYLQLCQDFVAELGLSGGTGPSDVTGNKGELNNVTRWIRDSSLAIDNLWLDWKYLWCRYSVAGATIVTPITTLPAPANGVLVRLWDKNKFRFRIPGDTWQDLPYVTREQMQQQYDPDDASPGTPAAFTIMPDNSIALSAPLDLGYDFKAEFWRRPIVLTQKTDVPLLPAEFHRIILTRAAVYYGNREDAPEIINGMEAEYMDALDKLQSDQLEGQSLRRTSTDRDRQPDRSSLNGFLV
jgi:hypothetical protein